MFGSTNLARARRSYLLAMGLGAATLAGCQQRERWPEEKTDRPKPPPEPPCRNGEFCVPSASSAEDTACETYVPLPAGAAAELTPEKRRQVRVRFDGELTATHRAGDPGHASCCYRWLEACRGRPLLVDGEALLASAAPRGDWIQSRAAVAARRAAGADEIDEPTRAVLERHWLREAAHEHASIASFALLALDLVALGAPPELLREVTNAALDEIRHAEIAFALASTYGRRSLGPSPLAVPPRPRCATPGDLALDTYRSGCVAETVAAALAGEAAAGASPLLATILRGIAADEQRHAALSWRVTAWALRRGSAGAARMIAHESELGFGFPATTAAAETSLVRFGVLAPTERRRTASRAIRSIVMPCTRALLALAA